MAGLCVGGLGIYPSGYTAPPHRPALNKAPILAEPAAYNRPIVPTALGAKRHITMATPGLKWPSPIVKMDAWNNLKGPADHWQIMPKNANTFKELPSVNRRVEAADKPYSQSAAIKAVVATTAGGAIEPKKSILDIARSFVLTAINPEVKDWWARRVNSLDQLEAIAATRSLTHSETIIRDNILREITEKSNNTDNLAINAPAYVAPAAPAPAATSTTSTSTTSTSTTSTSTTSTSTTSTAIASPSAGTPGGSPGGSPILSSSSTPVAAMPGGSPILSSSSTPVAAMPGGPPSPVKLHLPGSPALSPKGKPAGGPEILYEIGPPRGAGPNGTIVEINESKTALAFSNLMKDIYKKGFNRDDVEVWIGPAARVAKKGIDKVKKLQPDSVDKNPMEAFNYVLQKLVGGKHSTAIAMQYCIERNPASGHPKIIDYMVTKEIDEIFSDAYKGKFKFNPGFQARLV